MLNKERRTIDITTNSELLRLVREMAEAKQPLSLREDDREVAVLTPSRKLLDGKRQRKSGILTKNDPLFGIIGIGRSDGPTDVSTNKHKYLAEVYLAKHDD